MAKYFHAALFWTVFVFTTLTIFVWLVIVFLFHRFFRKDQLNNACHNVATFWGTTSMRLAPGWRYTIIGEENLPRAKPAMLVANHASAVDIWAIFLLRTQFRWLSKDSVFRLPIIGWAMKWAGYVPVSRGNKRSQIRALEASRNWLRKGISMVFFPEGTRSEDGRVQEFKSGAFRIAIDEGVDVIPVVLRGTRDMLLKASAMPCPASLCVEILTPVPPVPGESAESYAERVRAIIVDRLETQTPFEKDSAPLQAVSLNAKKG